jgi:hypothetical protein
MTDGAIYEAGWSLDDIEWSRFDLSKVDSSLLAAVRPLRSSNTMRPIT